MLSILCVGVGGFTGSVLRYELGRIPIAGDFPFMTMLINILGSFAIGLIFEFGKDKTAIGSNTPIYGAILFSAAIFVFFAAAAGAGGIFAYFWPFVMGSGKRVSM